MPIGYAMIGKLAPKQYQGVMMGSWMLVTGLASLFAGDFSGIIPEPTGTTTVASNAGYAKLFVELGLGSLAVGIVLVVLIPFLRKLIIEKVTAKVPEARIAFVTLDTSHPMRLYDLRIADGLPAMPLCASLRLGIANLRAVRRFEVRRVDS
jgi:hypothetical protein